ncbi:MAG: hypothetical protein AMJ88_07805 [Anaerolineae bacterium SM23_ 63]|nr:MAG: hypothetical protein AMJ88_07805 [Anaerolineae bacterium SM23_ 63]HEY48189.1 DUF4349 domain-containing protein [Anaerolineae bacterium]
MNRLITISLLLLLSLAAAACASPAMRQSEGGFPIEAPVVEKAPVDETVFGAPSSETVSDFASPEVVTERLVIRNANLTIVVLDPSHSVEDISQMAQEMGGFVVSSNIYQTTFDDTVLAFRASITIRVPAERLDEALSQIKDDAMEIRNENISGQDVTQEYTDLKSQLRNLEAAEEELLEIMDASTEAEHVLDVFEHLRQVRNEIEITKGRIQYYEESARMSAISVEIIPDVAARPLQIGRWQPEGTAKAALEALISALQFLGNAVIWGLICVVPIGVILGLPTFFVVRTIHRRRKVKDDDTETAS